MPEGRQETVDVWLAPLDVDDDTLADLEAELDAEELARAGRLRFDRDRRRFVAAHGFLRRVLARYLGCDPHDVRFRRRADGKPELESRSPRFNLAHSHDLVACAVAPREVGIDVEHVDSVADAGFLRSVLPEASRDRAALLAAWTRNEAYAKATGAGLREIPLEVDTTRWTVQRIEVPPGYVGAVAAAGRGWRVERVLCESPALEAPSAAS